MPDDAQRRFGADGDDDEFFATATGTGPTRQPPTPPQARGTGTPPADDPPPRRASRRRQHHGRSANGSFLRELPILLLIAFVLAFLLRTFVLQVFYIPSGSMEPTLAVNDRMVVEKVTYRFREPARGEIAVFEGEDVSGIGTQLSGVEQVVRGVGQFLGVVPVNARDFVKRVIGLPGDEIHIVDGEVRVNGVLLDEPYVVHEDASDYGPVVVPDGSLFFLGDNRPNSSDSRRSLGFVDAEHVLGRAVLVMWPLEHLDTLTDAEHELAVDGEG